jgi:hypothetical protein
LINLQHGSFLPAGFDWHHPMKGVPMMGALNCIVVEDNNKQSALLKDYIAKIPNLSFSARCESAADVYHAGHPIPRQYHILGHPPAG